MTKENFTYIAVVLDRSGSMQSTADDVIGGFNAFITEQKKVSGKALITLAQFDDTYELIHDGVDISEVKDLTKETFIPRGGTALLDGIGRTISSVGSKLSSMQENERPAKVIVVIISDGQENASKEFIHSKVKEMVEHQTNIYSWQFIFMGAADGMNAIAQGQSMGFSSNNSYNFKKSKIGTSKLYRNLSNSITTSRTTGSIISLDAADLMDDTDTTSST